MSKRPSAMSVMRQRVVRPLGRTLYKPDVSSRQIGPARGIVRRSASDADEPHHHARLAPPDDLAPFVEHFWTVRWDRRGLPPFVAETLPHPSVHVVLERGASALAGVSRKRFSRTLEGRGEVYAIKFRPGGARPFLGGSIARFSERVVPLALLGEGWSALEERVLGIDADDVGHRDALRAEVCAAFLRARQRPLEPREARAQAIVARIVADHTLLRVEELVESEGMSERELQRLFREHVGVSAKWVIQRRRLHEALARMETSAAGLATLAADLGYVDQAHFSRDFRAMVGVSPGAYARRLTEGARTPRTGERARPRGAIPRR